MLTRVNSAKCIGIDAVRVTVEVDITPGIGIHLVGLADAAVRESLLRTVTAIQALGYRIPGKRIIINLAPADLHKSGSGYDVPIALGILIASGQIHPTDISDCLFLGELALDGQLRKVPGALPVVEMALKNGLGRIGLPLQSAREAADFNADNVYALRSLQEVIAMVCHPEEADAFLVSRRLDLPALESPRPSTLTDFADIVGQEQAKRGLEIAASGGHNVMMIGSPGSGKSSLARAFAGILPPMTREESLQTSKIYSVYGRTDADAGLIRQRPFRSPHHSASLPAFLGGGSDYILPGEVSLAHNGVLFLDEFCEAPKRVIEALRAPLEDRHVTISRLKTKVEYPASFMLVAAMNPCPCGYFGEGDRCTCSVGKRLAYLSRLSGPMMDRIDIQLWLHPVAAGKLVRGVREESSAQVAARVTLARQRQLERFAGEGIFTNAQMDARQIKAYCRLDEAEQKFLEEVMERMGFSARACTRIIKLARTIADLEGADEIALSHLSEAANYRFLDRVNLLE